MERQVVEIEGRPLEIGSLAKVFWPKGSLTKGDLLQYYLGVSEAILPHLEDRPMVMNRYPDGVEGKSFYQKRCPEYAPDWLARATVKAGEEAITYCLCNDVPSLLWLANQGCIEMHPWLSRVDTAERPDFLVLDLDPSEEVPFSHVIEVALLVRKCLQGLDIVGYPKTSGATGLHVYVPVVPKYSYAEVRGVGEFIAGLIAEEFPSLATVERTVKFRSGKVYVDYLQNVEGKTLASVYSVRPTAAATVSMPVTWEEVESGELTPEMFTVRNAPERIRARGDLFAPVLKNPVSLDRVLQAVGPIS